MRNVELISYVLSRSDTAYVFVLQPALAMIRSPLDQKNREAWRPRKGRDMGYFRECYRLIDEKLSLLDRSNFHYVNLSGMFDRIDHGRGLFIDSSHFGDKGNELVAREIFARIEHLVLPSVTSLP
jgi:hypothetical protein